MAGKRRIRGKGTIYYRVARGKWFYQYSERDANGGLRKLSKALVATSRKAAEAEAKDMEHGVSAPDKAGLLVAIDRLRRDAATLPMGMVWQHFLLAKPTAGEGTRRNYQRAVEDLIKWGEATGIKQAGDVTEDVACRYMASLWQGGLSANTYMYRRNALGLIWRTLARRFGLDPVWDATPRQKSGYREGHRPLSAEQAAALLELVETSPRLSPCGEWRALICLQLFAGMRLKDAALLEWRDVDIAEGVIRYTPHKTRGKGKTAVVPLLPPVALALEALPRENAQVLPSIAASYSRGSWRIDGPAVALVQAAVGGNGKPTGKAPAQRQRTRAAYAAHSLRTTFCTQAARVGATALQLATMTGDSASTVAKFYVDADLIRAQPLPEFHRLLPGKSTNEREPEREQLRRLAGELPIEAVRKIVRQLSGAAALPPPPPTTMPPSR